MTNAAESAEYTWIIDADHAGMRLDRFVSEQLPERSRSSVQKAIKQGEILVNGSGAAVHRFLKENDSVAWHPKHHHDLDGVSAETLPPLEIVEETDEYLVIDKPAGLLVHPDAKTQSGTLVDLLIAHHPKIAQIGENPLRPGIVHRLDRDVSGLMLVAKTQHAYDELKRQFAQRETKKTYRAFVYGSIKENEGDIKFRIARSSTKARMAARPEHETEGRAAWTHYRVLERFPNASLVELEIFSGRTHQIRAHMLAFGHPVMGDPLYPPKKPPRNIAPPRLMLQSVGLEFKDPATGAPKTYRLEPHASFDEMKVMLEA